MFSFSSVWAIVIRHMRVWQHDINTLLFGFYWPLLDILTMGFLGSWIQQSQAAEFHNYQTVALMGVLLWAIIGRGCNIIIFMLAEELWANNILNLFSLPLRISEWMAAVAIFYTTMICATSLFCMFIASLFYDVSMWSLLSTFIIFAPPLFISGIWVGFTCLQIIITLGRRGLELGFVIGWFLLPFSGAYYPIEILPKWGQAISSLLPMSYVFQGMRAYLIYQQNPTSYLLKGYGLSVLYAACALMLFAYCFNRSKHRGLARLTD